MISDKLSLLTAWLELFLFTGSVFGFSFLEYVLKEELIFYDERCDPSKDEEGVLCEDALTFYNLIFTCIAIATNLGSVILGFAEGKIGMLLTRLIANTATTSGLVILTFYPQSGYCVMAAFILMSFPCSYYIVSNCCIVSYFGTYSNLLVVLMPAIFDMSMGLFLLVKLGYQNGIDPILMLQILAASSALVWIRTLTLMPINMVDLEQSLWCQSVVGSCFNKKVSSETAIKSSEEPEELPEELPDILPYIKTVNLWQYTAWFTLLYTRVGSIEGWIYPWIEWTYSPVPDSEDMISKQLDIYGFLFYASCIIGLVPGFISSMLRRYYNQYVATLYTLIILMGLSTVICVINSIQMCFQADSVDDTGNSISFIILFTLVKTWFFSTSTLFLYTFYPIELMSPMFGLITIPNIVFLWIIDPLYRLILDGPDIAEADFVPVSIGMAVVSVFCGLSVIYTYRAGKKMMAESNNIDTTDIPEGKEDFSEL